MNPRPGLAPTACLDFEPDEAKRLGWLPLAVRFKLDQCGLRFSLREWRALPLATRATLLAAPLDATADGFLQLALGAGARQGAATARMEFSNYVARKVAEPAGAQQ